MDIKCNLIVDSCCDLPHEILKDEGVYLLKFPYIAEDGEHMDDLYQSVTPKEFYDKMREGDMPSTAQIPYPDLQAAIAWAASQDKPCVWLSFSSGLSGTYNTIDMLVSQAREENPDLQLEVVDTKLASVAEGLLVFEALRQRQRGLTASELAAWANEAQWFVNCGFMVDDLNALKHGGRIPASVAFAGSKLDVKVLLSIDLDGKLSMIGVARGRKKGFKALAERYAKGCDKGSESRTVLLGNADCPKDSQKLWELISKEDEGAVPLESSIGPVIGSHVGPGMVAVVYWGEDRRNSASVSDRIASRMKASN
ncbi:MAG: DegV family protein [Coriobacteriia bacterium]|nr:DegV family protein [Coriobacteriia bacterium]